MAERKAIGKCGNLIAVKEGRGKASEGGKVQLVGLMGCAVKRMGAEVFKALPGLDFAVGPRRFGLIPRLVARCRAGETHLLELPDDDEVPSGLDAHAGPSGGQTGFACYQSYVTVLLGCDNRCSYCIVPDVRGHEYSRPARVVAIEAFAAVEHGGPAQLAQSVYDGAGGGQDLLRAQLTRGPGLLFGDRRSGRGCQRGKAGKAYQKQRQRTQQRRADADMDKIANDGSPLKTGKKPPYITP